MHDYVVLVHERYRGLDGGEPASYIPELAMVEPDHFGISVLTTDGQGNGVGDVGVEFSIQ
jgi:glutaminase